MATLPSPFLDPGSAPSEPDEAAASVRLTSADAAAEFQFVDDSAPSTDEAAVAPACVHTPATAADLSDIGQIFIGAAKLFDPDPDAYTSADQAYYDLLLQLDDPHAPDLRELPYGMDGIFDPPPLFLREAAA